MMAGCQHTCRVCAAWSDREAMQDRFDTFVGDPSKTGCREWTGHRNRRGYGRFDVGGVPEYAHRVAVILDGRDIPEGMQVDHLCHNPPCVNPDHLEVVTPAENRDRKRPRVGASGVPGVSWNKNKRKWRVKVRGKYVGDFSSLDDAANAANGVVL